MLKLFILLITITLNVYASNWLIVQGIQNDKAAEHNLWGFGQLRYINNYGDVYEAGGINKTPFSMNKPSLEEQESLIIARLRIGLRGKLDSENKINYFILTEFAQNGITNPAGHTKHSYLTDLSVTFRYLPANIRVGQFKYPGSEEGLMTRFASPFIQFTTMSDQLLLERFISVKSKNSTTYLGEPAHSVGAYRDTGIELFQKLNIDDANSISYAYMTGLGSGLQMQNVNDSHPTHYIYTAYENIFGKGKAYNTESFKFYMWYQDGKRKLLEQLYDRTRYGLGFTYYDGSLRLESEYVRAKGMIYTGAKDVNALPDQNEWQFEMEAADNNKANGYYISSQYKIIPQLELLARYDQYNRMTNVDSKERVFKNTTLGTSYRFDGFNRIDFNYTYAKAYAPHNTAAQNLDNTDNIARIQVTMVYK